MKERALSRSIAHKIIRSQNLPWWCQRWSINGSIQRPFKLAVSLTFPLNIYHTNICVSLFFSSFHNKMKREMRNGLFKIDCITCLIHDDFFPHYHPDFFLVRNCLRCAHSSHTHIWFYCVSPHPADSSSFHVKKVNRDRGLYDWLLISTSFKAHKCKCNRTALICFHIKRCHKIIRTWTPPVFTKKMKALQIEARERKRRNVK